MYIFSSNSDTWILVLISWIPASKNFEKKKDFLIGSEKKDVQFIAGMLRCNVDHKTTWC